MLSKFLPVALVATAVSISFAEAQTRPPAEQPPAGFAGQQYVDSRGCVYIRAGYGGQTNWVARVDRARRPVCGQTPSVAVMAAAKRELAQPVAPMPAPVAAPAQPVAAPAKPVVAPSPARPVAPAGAVAAASYVPPPVVYGAPMPLQPAPRQVAVPHAPAAPQVVAPVAPVVAAPSPVQTAPAAPVISRTAGCPAHAPVGQVYELRRGGSMLVCASGPHRLTGLRPGDVEQMAAARGLGGGEQATRHVQVTGGDLMTPPPGYKAAWRDDRLNPNRARGTQEGHQQMLQVWTDKVPQQLRHPAYAQPKRMVASSKSGPAPVGSGARFVQVGSFGVPDNAARAAARLKALGLPVQVGRGQIKGKPVQVVKAGPFASEAQAVAALGAARGAGFSDAILRR